MNYFSGIAASRGIAFGPIFHFRQSEVIITRNTVSDTQAEWERFLEALGIAKVQLQAIYETAREELGEEQAAIFEAHQMVLDDPDLLDAVHRMVFEQCINCESALSEASESFAKLLEALDDEYFRARAVDVRDVAGRLVRILMGKSESPTKNLKQPSIIVAYDLMPSDTAQLDKSLVLGFCTSVGGATSHSAILARSLALPAVVGAGNCLMDILEGKPAILDGNLGTLIIDPDETTIDNCLQQQSEQRNSKAVAMVHAHQPATTIDGFTVEVIANIGNLEDARGAVEAGAEGVGLFRTEFLYLEHSELPDEETQYQAYKAILEVFGTLPVILRTLDIGGDKELPYLKLPTEMNPFLGLRAIRLCFAHPELFKPQLRAALRAGVGHNLKIMFPMIATVGEVRQARRVFEECRQELKSEGIPTADNIEIGIMVEIPAAAVQADLLAQEVDFFSIGTNDLSQYTMAADRTNSTVANLTSCFQPPVLRLVQQVIEAGHRSGKRVGMCGEMAGEPLAVPLLIGFGLDDFSMNPSAIPEAKQIIRSIRRDEAELLARQALNETDPKDIQAMVSRFLSKL
ncbi:MAG: phosphoenolpyruvate--protein phosphotransferase [Chloroflexi bacterium]|nr:MAG: phosphoenolpyruvate--protein phosphotransferase [Chloroflexota bacterium]